MAAVYHLGYACLDTISGGGLYRCAKLGSNRRSSFHNASFNIFRVWHENAYSRPPFWVYGVLTL